MEVHRVLAPWRLQSSTRTVDLWMCKYDEFKIEFWHVESYNWSNRITLGRQQVAISSENVVSVTTQLNYIRDSLIAWLSPKRFRVLSDCYMHKKTEKGCAARELLDMRDVISAFSPLRRDSRWSHLCRRRSSKRWEKSRQRLARLMPPAESGGEKIKGIMRTEGSPVKNGKFKQTSEHSYRVETSWTVFER